MTWERRRGANVSDEQSRGIEAAGERQQLTLIPQTLRMTPLPSPKKIVFSYEPDEFEEFVKEWVPAIGRDYVLVERHGGSGDHGIDVACYLSAQRLEGDWHNYQCKHYRNGLTWSSAAQEIRKMFAAVIAGHFILPSRYVFVAPIITRALVRQLAKPGEARGKFLRELATTTDKLITSLTPEQRTAVADLAGATDFSMFEGVDMDVMLEQHRKTPHWTSRFPHQQLEGGPEHMQPPAEHGPDEARYVQQLVSVYQERWGDETGSLERIAGHAMARDHLQRQREAFYSAESLRVFARDHTPEGHFDGVLKDVYDIVVEVADGTYALGWDRLQAVLQAAGSVALTPTVLAPYVRPADRKGLCHHLANADRLTWCPGGQT